MTSPLPLLSLNDRFLFLNTRSGGEVSSSDSSSASDSSDSSDSSDEDEDEEAEAEEGEEDEEDGCSFVCGGKFKEVMGLLYLRTAWS